MISGPSAQLKKVLQRVKRSHPRLPVMSVFKTLNALHRGQGSWFAPSDVWERLPRYPPKLVLETMTTLADEPFSVLKTQWVFYTGHEPSPDDPAAAAEIPISPSEALEAARSGQVENPETGQRVSAAGRVGLFFVPNELVWKATVRHRRSA